MTRMFFPYSFYPFKAMKISFRIFFSLKLNPLGHFILGMIFMITNRHITMHRRQPYVDQARLLTTGE